MKVFKSLIFISLYIFTFLLFSSFLNTTTTSAEMQFFSLIVLVCSIVFVLGVEVYHKSKNSVNSLMMLFAFFLMNVIIMSSLIGFDIIVANLCFMLAIFATRLIVNNKIVDNGCYNLWVFSAFTIMLYFILIFNVNFLVLIFALATLVKVTSIEFKTLEEYKNLNYLQNTLGLLIITITIFFM